MPKNTSKTTTNQTQSGTSSFNNSASYGQIQPESNKYIDAFEDFRPQGDPTIGFRAGDAKRRLASSFSNPLGGYATPAMKDAIMRSESRGIDQDAAQQFRAGQYDTNQQRMGQLGSLASLMAPRIVQTGSSGTGATSGTSSGTQNTETGKNLFGNILDIGMGAASMAMM
jgi:hypothetical protein